MRIKIKDPFSSTHTHTNTHTLVLSVPLFYFHSALQKAMDILFDLGRGRGEFSLN